MQAIVCAGHALKVLCNCCLLFYCSFGLESRSKYMLVFSLDFISRNFSFFGAPITTTVHFPSFMMRHYHFLVNSLYIEGSTKELNLLPSSNTFHLGKRRLSLFHTFDFFLSMFPLQSIYCAICSKRQCDYINLHAKYLHYLALFSF